MNYFVSLLGDAATFFGDDKQFVLIDAEVGPVTWEKEQDVYCVIPQPEPLIIPPKTEAGS